MNITDCGTAPFPATQKEKQQSASYLELKSQLSSLAITQESLYFH